MAPGRGKGKGEAGKQQSLVFDPKERVEFVKGFGKRKQVRREIAKKQNEEKERQMRIMLRQKRKDAIKKSMEAKKLGTESAGDYEDDLAKEEEGDEACT